MREEFDWDDANLAHIADHGIAPEEAEQASRNDPLELDVQYIRGEERFPIVGVTNSGRFLVVVTTERAEKIRVVTAFPANNLLIAMYLKNKFWRQ